MCYAVSTKKIIYAEDLSLTGEARKLEKTPRIFVSGFTHPRLPLQTVEEPAVVTAGIWGLVPAYIEDAAKARDMAGRTLNARSETLHQVAAFKPYAANRCLIHIQGFFEWKHVGKERLPHYIFNKDDEKEGLLLGGIYSRWPDPAVPGREHLTFSVITTEANPLLAEICNSKKRMPLVLDKDAAKQWLDANTPSGKADALMRPADDKMLGARPIRRFNPNAPNPLTEQERDTPAPPTSLF